MDSPHERILYFSYATKNGERKSYQHECPMENADMIRLQLFPTDEFAKNGAGMSLPDFSIMRFYDSEGATAQLPLTKSMRIERVGDWKIAEVLAGADDHVIVVLSKVCDVR